MYEDGVDGDSLKEVLMQACKRIDLGTAIVPKALFYADGDEPTLMNDDNDNDDDDDDDNDDGETKKTMDNKYYEKFDSSSKLREGLAPDNLQDYFFDTGNTGKKTSTPMYTNRYSRTLQNEFNAVVIEHHLKWAPLCVAEPGPLPNEVPSQRLGRYDFHHVDAMVDWAIQHKMKVKGHVLCWHVTSPQTILEGMSSKQVEEELKRHIFTTMGHFRGRIKIWDVVNEALAPDGRLAENIFLRKIGPSYIEKVFRWAHEADPTAILLYNDNKVEGMDGPNKAKADAFYNLLADLVDRQVPIHGCGIQAHFNAAGVGRNRPPTPRMVKNQIHRLGELGLSVNISEMDVRVSQLSTSQQRIAQRQIYRDIVAAALTEPSFDGIWLWGFTDRHTWVTHFYEDDEPLIFDQDYGRKEAYYGLQEALSSIIPGGVVGAGVPLDSDIDEDGNAWGHLWMQPEPTSSSEYVPPTDLQSDHSDTSVGGSDLAIDKPDWEIPELT